MSHVNYPIDARPPLRKSLQAAVFWLSYILHNENALRHGTVPCHGMPCAKTTTQPEAMRSWKAPDDPSPL